MSTLAVEVVNGNPVERILVIAPNLREAIYWCRERQINPNAPNVRHVFQYRHLRGYRNAWYVNLGYPLNPEGAHIRALLAHLIATSGFKNAETA